jgi:hypothetical protein
VEMRWRLTLRRLQLSESPQLSISCLCGRGTAQTVRKSRSEIGRNEDKRTTIRYIYKRRLTPQLAPSARKLMIPEKDSIRTRVRTMSIRQPRSGVLVFGLPLHDPVEGDGELGS